MGKAAKGLHLVRKVFVSVRCSERGERDHTKKKKNAAGSERGFLSKAISLSKRGSSVTLQPGGEEGNCSASDAQKKDGSERVLIGVGDSFLRKSPI